MTISRKSYPSLIDRIQRQPMCSSMNGVLQPIGILLLLVAAMTLSGCTLTAMTIDAAVSAPSDLKLLYDHKMATQAIVENKDVDAAIGYLDGTRFNSKTFLSRRQIAGGLTWAELGYEAALLVEKAHNEGRDIDDKVLLRAYEALANNYSLVEQVKYLELARPLLIRKYGEDSNEVRKIAMDGRQILLAYLRAGGRLYGGRDYLFDFSFSMLDKARAKTLTSKLAYQPELLMRFPLRMSDKDRRFLFSSWERGGRVDYTNFPPVDKWNNKAAIEKWINDYDYPLWLYEIRINWNLEKHMSAMGNRFSICYAQQAGLYVVLDEQDGKRWEQTRANKFVLDDCLLFYQETNRAAQMRSWTPN